VGSRPVWEIHVVESRSAEPTRVVIGESPDLGNSPLAHRGTN